MKLSVRCFLAFAVGSWMAASVSAQVLTNTWTNSLGGSWNVAGNWNPNDVPDATNEVALLPLIAGANYTAEVTQVMFPSGLSNQRVWLNPTTSSGSASSSIVVNASGTLGSPLEWTIGDLNLPGTNKFQNFLSVGRSSTLSLQFVNFNLVSSNAHPATDAGTYLNVAGTVLFPARLVAVNSQIILSNAPAGAAGNNAVFVGQGSTLAMTGGVLRVIKSGNNSAGLNVSSDGSRVFLTNTLFDLDTITSGFGSLIEINNGGLSSTSRVNRGVSIQGSLNFKGGIVEIGAVATGHLQFQMPVGVGGSEIVTVSNSTVLLRSNSDILMNPGGSHPGGGKKVHLNLQGSGSVAARNASVGGNAPASPAVDDYQITLSNGSPALLLSGNLSLGSDKTGAGRLIMAAGTLVASNLFLGSATADGYYEQTAGTAVVSNSVIFQKGATVGAQRFKVGTGASLTLMGTGMVFAGSGSFLIDAADWDTSGTLAMAPSPTISTQQLTIAGLFLGTGASAYSNNFSIGTLDLSAYGPGHRLQLLAPQSAASTALYVGVISPIATNALISAFDVYYDPGLNPVLFAGAPQGIYGLSGGGFLIPLPEPSVAWLILLGGLAMALPRRARS